MMSIPNPFLNEIRNQNRLIEDLIDELDDAPPTKVDQIRAELKAKLAVLSEVNAQSDEWRDGRIETAVTNLEVLAQSQLAAQANVVARLKRLTKQIRGESSSTFPIQPGDEDEDISPIALPIAAAGAIEIIISDKDMDALARVAASEVQHFGKYGVDQLTGGLSAVVETILNRVAHKRFGNSIEAVVNKPLQFSAVNNHGSWQGLPPANAQVRSIVESYIDGRVAGAKALLGGATHFLNPYKSSESAMNGWGKHVVTNAVAVFGNDAKKDVHYHGFAPGYGLPDEYSIRRGSGIASFTATGIVAGAAADLRQGILDTLDTELTFFGNGASKEADDPHFKRVGKYWECLGIPYDGRTQLVDHGGSSFNPAWSAAFISWVVTENGAADRFKCAQAHWKYVDDILDGRTNPLFDVLSADDYAPIPGDIVHYGREGAKKYNFATAKAVLQADGSYASHSDFVFEISSDGKFATTVGGNVSNSVKSKKVQLDKNGKLLPRVEGGNEYPWIAVLRLIA